VKLTFKAVLPGFHDSYLPLMQSAFDEAADKVERAFLQILLLSLYNNNKEVSVPIFVLFLFQLWDGVCLYEKANTRG